MSSVTVDKNQVIGRVLYIDVAKVIVAFLVIFGHLYSADTDASIVRRYIYTFHMPFFFFISGIFHKYSADNPFGNIWKYVRTIIIPALFFILLFIMIIPPLFGIVDHGGNYFVLLVEAFKVQVNEFVATTHLYYNQVCWFLFCLFWCKVFTDIIFWKKWVGGIVIVLSLAVCWYLHTSVTYLIQAVLALPFYIMGNKCKVYLDRVHKVKYKGLIAFSLGFLCYGLMMINGRVTLLGHILGSLPFPFNVVCFYINALLGSLMIIFIASTMTYFSSIATNLSKSLITVVGLQSLFFLPIIHWFNGYNLNVGVKVLISLVIILLCYWCHLLIVKFIPFVLGKNV